MSEDNSAQEATEEVQTPSQVLGAETTLEPVSLDNGASESDEGDYSWMPETFMKEGEPDYQGLAKSYGELRTKFSEEREVSKADDYDYELTTKGLFTEDMLPQLKAHGVDWGLSKDQFQHVASIIEGIAKDQHDAYSEVIGTADQTKAALEGVWGDKFNQHMNNVDRAWNAFAPEGMSADVVGNNPDLYQFMSAVGAELSEDKAPSKIQTGNTELTEDELKTLVTSEDYYSSDNTDAAKKVEAYFKRKFPG